MTVVSVGTYIFSRGKAKANNVDYEKLLLDIRKIVDENIVRNKYK